LYLKGKVNSAFYVEVIGRLLKRIPRVSPQFQAEGISFLLHENTPFYSTLVVKTYLAKHGAVEIGHPPYSPDLAPADVFLFPTVKTALKGKRFQDVEDIKKDVTAQTNGSFAVLKNPLNDGTNVFKQAQKTISYFPVFFHTSPGTLLPCLYQANINTSKQ
jgi:hypothetical protein